MRQELVVNALQQKILLGMLFHFLLYYIISKMQVQFSNQNCNIRIFKQYKFITHLQILLFLVRLKRFRCYSKSTPKLQDKLFISQSITKYTNQINCYVQTKQIRQNFSFCIQKSQENSLSNVINYWQAGKRKDHVDTHFYKKIQNSTINKSNPKLYVFNTSNNIKDCFSKIPKKLLSKFAHNPKSLPKVQNKATNSTIPYPTLHWTVFFLMFITIYPSKQIITFY
eukprot:TRINITY_DN9403_c0_g2_i4.p4 TRINITY_DN9403_c0_g2~~TRINITY_DN9403_c0_g2_i4.p4  ORF type:complete len:225 (+),score=-5.84 TRINITY_DN9403_c0_g2_i4:1144-1818(+)